jgi:hypothetical protein
MLFIMHIKAIQILFAAKEEGLFGAATTHHERPRECFHALTILLPTSRVKGFYKKSFFGTKIFWAFNLL